MPGRRPQDPMDDGNGWTFQTLDHDETGVPHVLAATDPMAAAQPICR